MRFYQQWIGCIDDGNMEYFRVNVPGNIQYDYGVYKNYGDVNFADNYKKYRWLEEYGCTYKTKLSYEMKEGQRLFFVSHGIDYSYKIYLNEKELLVGEGMFSTVELDLTDYLCEENILEVKIDKVPKAIVQENEKNTRFEAKEAVKPPVSYGWDFCPRIITSGIWEDTYLETRGKGFICDCEAFYELNADYSKAIVKFEMECKEKCFIELCSPDGQVIYQGYDTIISVANPLLWWCNGHGEANLYTYTVSSSEDIKRGRIGFRHIELVINDGWDSSATFPMTRTVPPITVCLNGRRIFTKGSNLVNSDIFFGNINRDTYVSLVKLASEAHMNMLRCWGGSIVDKDAFYELCDENGIMVWQDFPLSCICYEESAHYLEVLKKEAISIVKKLRSHPCHVIWCGGNELFNWWSKMTDQSSALRLLNSICYQLDLNKPYIMTSPLMGMAHGFYEFFDDATGEDVIQKINRSRYTAYVECGVCAMSSMDILKKTIPEEQLSLAKMLPETIWQERHAFRAWHTNSWAGRHIMSKYFGKLDELEDYIEKSWMLQCVGLKAVLEEARRQAPYCSMVLTWCFNEPWYTAAGCNLVSWDGVPKDAYYTVKNAMRPTIASARSEKFEFYGNEIFTAQLWYLNDSPEGVMDTVTVYIELDGEEIFLSQWNTGLVEPWLNKEGVTVQYVLPNGINTMFKLKLKSKVGNENEYIYLLKKKLQTNLE